MQARLDAQRTAIVDAAGELLAERGYGACTIVAVAERAGIAAGTVYNHFDGKAGLITTLFEAVVGREVDVVRTHAAYGTAAGRIRAVIETFGSRALKSPCQAYALLAEPVDPAVDALRLRFRETFRDVLADAIAAGVHTGELPPQNPTLVAAALVGGIAEALTGPLTDRVTAADGADTVSSLITFANRAVGVPADANA